MLDVEKLDLEEIHNTDDLIEQVLRKKSKRKYGTFLEIHSLRSYGPGVLNRDENGDAKTVYIGGIKRTTASSACIKYPIRQSVVEEGTNRTRFAPEIIANYIADKYEVSEQYKEDAKKVAYCLIAQSKPKKASDEISISEKDVVEKKCRAKTMNYIGECDIERIGEAIYKAFPTEESIAFKYCEKTKSNAAKYVLDNKKSYNDLYKELAIAKNASLLDPDVGFMGRMSTTGILDTVDSAVYFNFNYSVNGTKNDSDFFTAQDTFSRATDLFTEDDDTAGAGHLNVRDIGANTYYGYAGISLETVIENAFKGFDFENDKANIIPRLNTWFSYLYELVEAMINVTPDTMQHQMASRSRPAVYVTLKQGKQNLTYDDAFEHEICATDDHSVMENAVIALNNSIMDDPFETGTTIKKYWISKEKYSKYVDDSIPKTTLPEMLNDIKGYFDESIGIKD